MSGWDDFDAQLPTQPQPKQTKPANNNQASKPQQQPQQQPQHQEQPQKAPQQQQSKVIQNANNAAQKPKVAPVENGPKRFQFFNSAKEKTVETKAETVSATSASTTASTSTKTNLVEEVRKIEVSESKKNEITQLLSPSQSFVKCPLVVNPNLDVAHKMLLRSKQGVFETSSYSQDLTSAKTIFTGTADYMQLSADEQTMLVVSGTVVKIIRIADQKVLGERNFVSIKHTNLSKRNNFVQVIDNVDNKKYIVNFLTFPDLLTVHEFSEKRYIKENAPYVKLNEEESKGFYYNYTNGFIEVYATTDFKTIIQQAEMQNLDFFQLSPKHEYIAGCFLEHMVGYEKTQAKLQFYNMEKDRREKVKNVEKAQEIALNWSPDGVHVIITTQTIHDTSGNTYYGQTALWLYSFGTKRLQLIPTDEGPVHDVNWAPNGENFVAIIGYMPAKPVLYTLRCEPVFSFGTAHRNTIRFQPQGRLVLFGGFGNLPGDIDIWDLNTLEKIVKFTAPVSASIEWSPDGKNILAGVLTPRLRVDNNYKMFKWNGELISASDFTYTELYEVAWKKNQAYSDKSPIPDKEIADEIVKQKKTQRAQKKDTTPSFGGGSFAQLLRSDKGEEGPKKITGDEEWLIKAKIQCKKVNTK